LSLVNGAVTVLEESRVSSREPVMPCIGAWQGGQN
jgi:hypothetical protein